MTLLDHINSLLQGTLTKAGQFWHQSAEPWLQSFLSTVGHDGAKVAAAAATDYVEQAAPALAKAVATQDWDAFADAQADVIKQVGANLLKNEEGVAVNDGVAAISALLVSHPAVVAAAAAAAPAPAPAA